GLEGTLTDAVSRLIIDNAILPRFRAGDLPGGVERGVDDIVQALSGDADDFKKRAAERGARPSGVQGLSSFAIAFIVLAIWIFLFVRASQRRGLAARRRSGWLWGPAGGTWSSGGWDSGGWSSGGGSDGGFSGGGGSFGGGGSSGGWGDGNPRSRRPRPHQPDYSRGRGEHGRRDLCGDCPRRRRLSF